MLLKEISYLILEELRAAHIVDDDNIDIRLLEQLIKQKRAQYIRNQYSNTKEVDVSTLQELVLSTTLESTGDTKILRSSSILPKIINHKGVNLIDNLFSSDKLGIQFTEVPFARLPYVGNGLFNNRFIHVAYEHDGYLYFKAKADSHKLLSTCVISAVFEDPEDVTGFDVDTDEYPIAMWMVESIKNDVIQKDYRTLITSPNDTLNNANGEVQG